MNRDEALLVAVLVAVGVQRLVELVVSRRNEAALLRRGGVRARPDGFALFFTVHAALFFLLPAEWFLLWWPRVGLHTWIFLGIAVAAALVRYWAAWSLGDRYTVRVIHVPGEPLVARGPYRWVRHPIYIAVLVEMAALPLIFGCWLTAGYLTTLNIVAVLRRVRLEEAHLGAAA